MTCHVPRLLLAAPASGSGKTTLTCALLRVLERRGLAPCAFKCGPDYIDPMFHRSVLALPSRNLDLFFPLPMKCGAIWLWELRTGARQSSRVLWAIMMG